MRFEMIPGIGVGPVLLGMSREQVRHALTTCADLDQTSQPKLDYAFGNCLQIEYDDDGHVHFIGVGYYTGCGCDFEFRGRHIAAYSSHELFALLSQADGGDHSYDHDGYFFPNIMVNVWEADEQYDYLGKETKPVYGQVGIANQKYCDRSSGKVDAHQD